jgi:hypothetical protein
MGVCNNTDTNIAINQRTDSEFQCSCLILILKLIVCVLWVWFSVSQFSLSGRSKAREPAEESHIYLEHQTSTILTHYEYCKSRNYKVTLLALNLFTRYLGLSFIYSGTKCVMSNSINFAVVITKMRQHVASKAKRRGTAATPMYAGCCGRVGDMRVSYFGGRGVKSGTEEHYFLGCDTAL